MPDPLVVLLDQNVPKEIADWLRGRKPSWTIHHVLEVGLEGKKDLPIFEWAQAHRALIITFDEDFADQRSFPVGTHHGIVRSNLAHNPGGDQGSPISAPSTSIRGRTARLLGDHR